MDELWKLHHLFISSLFIWVLVGGSNFSLCVNARLIFKVLHTLTASHSQQQSKFVEHEISSASSSAPHPPEPQDPYGQD